MNTFLSRISWQQIQLLWQRLTAPLVKFESAEEEQKAQLLASILLGVVVVLVALVPVRFVFQLTLPAISLRLSVVAVSSVMLLVMYRITRLGYYRTASWISIVASTIILFVNEILLPSSGTLYYLVVIMLFTSVFFTVRIMLMVATVQLVLLITLAGGMANRVNPFEILSGPGIFLITFTAVVTLFTFHRERLEAIRRSALAESETRYRIISDLISDYAYSLRVTPEGGAQVEWMTDSYTAATGYELEDLEISFGKTSHPDDKERNWSDLQAAIHGASTSGDYRIITRDGKIKWLNLYRRPEWDAAGQRVVRIYGVAKDITERKNVEARELELALQHERLNLLGRFVLATSQEFRTSLASIEVNRYLIQRKIAAPEAEKVREQLNQIRHYVSRLTGQLDNFHTVSALANMKTENRILNTEIPYILSGYTMRAADKNIALEFQPGTDIPPVHINVQEFGSALKSLLDNALAYTSPGGRICVRTRQEGQFVLVAVEDTGRGIEPEHLPHIFEMFYRADPARPLETGGAGLGLSVVQMVAQAHKGKVEVQSTPGKGSTFTLYLPVHPPGKKD